MILISNAIGKASSRGSALLLLVLAFSTTINSAPTGDANAAIVLSGTQLQPTDFYSIISASSSAPTNPTITAEDENSWLVEFYSPHCGHCKAFAPTWKELNEKRPVGQLEGGLRFGQFDCFQFNEFCRELKISSIPTIILFNNGKVVKEYSQSREINELLNFVDEENLKIIERRTAKSLSGEEEETKVVALETTREEVVVQSSVEAARIVPTVPAVTAIERVKLKVAEERPQVPVVAPLVLTSTGQKTTAGDGTSIVLDGTSLATLIQQKDDRPVMVKFYSPGCSHCKAFAPKWTALGTILMRAESPVQLYELDCTSSENRGVCSKNGVRGYPTVFWYQNGAKLEYTQAREVSVMQQWIKKMLIASATRSSSPSTIGDVKDLMSKSPVVFIFLHPQETVSIEESQLLNATKINLHQHASFHTTPSSTLYTHFGLSASTSHLLVLKSSLSNPYRSDTPVDPTSFEVISDLARRGSGEVMRFMNRYKWPMVVELTSDNWIDIMTSSPPNASTPSVGSDPNELVILYILSAQNWGGPGVSKLVETRILESAEGWVERYASAGTKRNQVIHAWIDGDRWNRFLINNYGQGIREVDEKGVRVIVIDVKSRRHYLRTMNDRPLTEASREQVYELIENGIWTGTAIGIPTEPPTATQRLLLILSETASSCSAHPFLAVIALLFLTTLLYRLLQRFTSSNSSSSNSLLPGANLSKGTVHSNGAPKLE